MIKLKKIFLTGILVFALVLVFSTQATFAVDVNINDAMSGGINGALAIANDADTIILASGTYNKTNEDNNITINKNVTIRGDGPPGSVIIDGRNQTKIFTISPNLNVTFINITFTNGNQEYVDNGTTNQGGAIYAVDTMLNFINCTFTNNTATNYGGAICAIRTSLSVIDANFMNNSVTLCSNGTGSNTIYYGGGAIYIVNGTLSVSTSNFTNNTAACRGGAVYGDNSLVDVNESYFVNNSATNLVNSTYGGAIYNTGANFNVTNSNFTGNYALRNGSSTVSSYGGAIYNTGANFSVANSNFTENYASSTSSSGLSTSGGGAIYNAGDNFSVVNSNFTENYASSINSSFSSSAGAGGAIYNTGANFSVANSNFTGNYALCVGSTYIGSYGGAIYNNGADFSVTNSYFTGNYALCNGSNNVTSSGGAIYNTGTNSSVINSYFTGNEVHSNGSNLNSYGGAIRNTGADFSVVNSNFAGNEVHSNGDWAYSTGGAIYNTGANFNVVDSTFTSNNGGAIQNTGTNSSVVDSTFISNNGGAIQNTGTNLTVVNSIFTTNNRAIYNYGANFTVTNSNFSNNNDGTIYNYGANLTVTNSNFSNNTGYNGGAIYNTGINLNIVDSNFTANNANREGGAIYNTGTNLTVVNSNFTNNNASSTLNGGAIFNTGNFSSVLNSTFSDNYANSGGAIYNTGGNFTVVNSTFSNNTGYSGSAIYNNLADNFNVVTSNFTDNNASRYAGAIYNYRGANFSVVNSNFTSNTGGISPMGVYGVGAIYNTGVNSSVVNSTFTSNNGNSLGGGIYNTGNNFIVDNCIFIGNIAYFNGGAISNIGDDFHVVNSTFTDNYASRIDIGTGGAIHNTGVNFSVVDSDFTNNNASGGGGAIYTSGNFSSVLNSTFTNNWVTRLNGGAIYNNASANFSVVNSNFTGNNARQNGGAIYNNASENCSIINSTFSSNNAIYYSSYGGGVYSSGLNFSIINSIFDENNAAIGGGVYIAGNDSIISNSNFTNNSQGIGIETIIFTLDNNRIIDNGIAIQFVLVNETYTISALSSHNYIHDNVFAIGISGTGSNYTVDDSFGLLNNGGIIFTRDARDNTIVDSDITGYYRSDSWAIFFNGYSSSSNSVVSSNITNNLNGIFFNESSGNNSVISCNISNNTIGILINGTNNSVLGCDIFNNELGIQVLFGSSNAVINYNRILNNINSNGFDLLNGGTNTNANYNWWGNNTPLVSGITLANHFVMALSANSYRTIVNNRTNQTVGNIELSYELVLIDSMGIISIEDYNVLPDFLVNLIWNSPSGTIYSLANVNGKGKHSYTVSLNYENSFSLEVIGDNADIILYLDPDLSNVVNITIIKTNNVSGNVSNGEVITYIITVTNHGPINAANGLEIIDVLDLRLIYQSASGDRTWNFDLATNTLTWDIGTLTVGGSVTLNITVRINGTGSIDNFANISNVNEINIGNNSTDGDDSNIDVLATINLTITKVINTSSANMGDLLTYTITVTNHGPDMATGLVVIDELDPRLIYQSAFGDRVYEYNATTHTVIWHIGDLALNGTVTLKIFVLIKGTGSIDNFANVTNVTDNNIGNNSTVDDNNTIVIPPAVNLTIIKTTNVTNDVNLGDLVTYTINVTNHGPDIATGVRVTDILDPRLIFVSTTGAYDEITGIWFIDKLDVNQTVSLNITVSINGTGNIVNIANVSSNEINIGNNRTGDDNSSINVPVLVTFIISKTINTTGNVAKGDLVTYTIILTNYGPNNATGVQVSDILDSRLVYLSSNASKGGYNPATGLWNIGNLNVGQTATLTIVVKVNASGTIVNTVSVFADQKILGASAEPVIINASDSIKTPDNPDNNPGDDSVSPDDINEDDSDENRVLGETGNSKVDMLKTGVPVIAIFTVVLFFLLLGGVFKRK